MLTEIQAELFCFLQDSGKQNAQNKQARTYLIASTQIMV